MGVVKSKGVGIGRPTLCPWPTYIFNFWIVVSHLYHSCPYVYGE